MKRSQIGFTMLELLIVVALVAILSAIAVPSYTNLIRRNNVASEGNKIVGALQLARSTAISGKYVAGICAELTPAGCSSTSYNFANGFVVFSKVDATPNNEVVETVQSKFVSSEIVVDITNNVRNGLVFNRLGRLVQADAAGAKIMICWDQKSTTQVPGMKISVSASGRIQSQKLGAIGTCNVTVDDDET
jgi:type IV fimbrial biogenesis protein FimT